MSMLLGKLEKVQIRSVWKKEDAHFTPWLGSEENIALLSETIGVELEVTSIEQRVGIFRADIICKDVDNDKIVLIENQFEYTDHKHLGQLLTYASGTQAVTMIWIAEHFTEEHRSVLDWLNRITDESTDFFGIEVELYRIGNSEPAPKFNIVSKPNEWSRNLRRAARNVEMTETREIQLEYWQELRKLLDSEHSDYIELI